MKFKSMETEQKQKKILFAGLTILVLAGVFLHSASLLDRNTPVIQTTEPQSLAPTLPTSSADEPEKSETDCFLKRKTDGEPETIFRAQNCYGVIERSDDYLFFPEGDGYKDENLTLSAYDLKTGNKQILYDLSQYRKDFGERLPSGIFFLRVIENNLYFSLSGYITGNAMYSIPLPLKSGVKPKLITANKNLTEITQEFGRYWITGGYGDGGGSTSFRAVFDPKTGKMGRMIQTQSDLGVGTHFMGARDDNAYIAEYDWNEITTEDRFDIKLSKIYPVDVNDLRRKKTVLSSKDLPEAMMDGTYSYESGQFFFLSANAVFRYDSETSKVKKVIDLKENSYYNISLMDNTLCLDSDGLYIDEQKISSKHENCSAGDTPKKLERGVEFLSLPKEFYLVIPEEIAE